MNYLFIYYYYQMGDDFIKFSENFFFLVFYFSCDEKIEHSSNCDLKLAQSYKLTIKNLHNSLFLSLLK